MPEMHSTVSSTEADSAQIGRPRLAVLDSGVGGLPYLHWVYREFPAASYLYLADTAAFPYGNREEGELTRLVHSRIECLHAQFQPDLYLIACNTASVVALDSLRERFPVPFVGVVPAVKPAAMKSRKRRIGIIATSGTVVNGYTDRLIKDFAADCRVVGYAGKEIVDFVERSYARSGPDARLDAVREACRYFKDQDVDSLVLGCTHFIHLRAEFQTVLGPEIEVVDSVEGVGRQVLRKLRELPVETSGNPVYRIYTTGSGEDDSYRDFSRIYGAVYSGVLPCP